MQRGNDGQILYNTLIEKEIIFEQVWQIYNMNKIPITEVEYKKLKAKGEYNGDYYKDKTWVYKEFNLDYNEEIKGVQKEKYETTMKTEENAYLSLLGFKDTARKDLLKILKKLKSPLVYYTELKKTEPIPVIVAATFAAIADLKKYGSLSANKMLVLSADNADATIEKFLLHSKINKYEESDYFIMRVVENLKYYFNLTPKPNERNFDESLRFDYKIIFDRNHYLIQKRKDEDVEFLQDRQEIDLNVSAIENEIENFKNDYLSIVNKKRNDNRKICEVLEMADSALKIYSDEIYQKSMDKIKGIVKPLDFHNDEKIRLVVLLDFTEEPFKNTHEILGKKSSNAFYNKRLDLKKDESAYSNAICEIIKELEAINRVQNKKAKDLINESRKNI